jgi:Probable Zinc-ribbon domain/Fungal Zn(2)-Cys(6) binuclear cluster domain
MCESGATSKRKSEPSTTKKKACETCNKHKRKCDKGTPCAFCVKKGVECVYTEFKKREIKITLAEARPDIAELWDYDANDSSITPETVSFGSPQKVAWVCPKTSCGEECSHKWTTSVNRMTSHITNSYGCPYCAHKLVCEHESLAALRPDVVEMLHPTKNVGVDPKTISVYSNKTFEFICHKSHPECVCGQEHTWPAMLLNITKDNETTCPYCNGRNTCLCRSFGYRHPDIAAQLDPSRDHPDPFTLAEFCNDKLWFVCEKHGSWEAAVASRVYHQTGCPDCKSSKLEEAASNILTKLGFTFKTQFKFKKGNTYRYDMKVYASEKYGTPSWLLEMDGLQHFEPSDFGSREPGAARKNYVYQFKQDLSKDFLATKKGMHLLRIPYTKGKRNIRGVCLIEGEILAFVDKMKAHIGSTPLHVRADPMLYEVRDKRNWADGELLSLVGGEYILLKVD